MRIPGWFFWLLLYTAAIFCWIVFFEHGPGAQAFQEGASTEFTRAWNGLRNWLSGR